ncbi:ABC transporter ATP-binding protein [candidate division KSB1 bacterium]|nr:MAG: ABC transporter ATP-binding protein [candidate division KSB1 bacterium]
MIQFIDVFKTYEDTAALKGLSFRVNRGEIFGLLGPNGAGKTTTVHILAGILPFDRGVVLIHDKNIQDKPDICKTIGIAPQALSLYENLTAEENIAFFGRLFGLKGNVLKQSVRDALDFVQLAAWADKRVKKFSGGMKRRLNLAAAIVHHPEILILDEPTVGVDPQSRNAIFDNIRRLKDEGCTIVYTTHYMEEAQQLCDHVAIIDHGRLMACGTVLELIARFGNQNVLVVETENGVKEFKTNDPLSVLENLKEKETILNFRLERSNLEQVFLNLTGHSLRDA